MESGPRLLVQISQDSASIVQVTVKFGSCTAPHQHEEESTQGICIASLQTRSSVRFSMLVPTTHCFPFRFRYFLTILGFALPPSCFCFLQRRPRSMTLKSGELAHNVVRFGTRCPNLHIHRLCLYVLDASSSCSETHTWTHTCTLQEHYICLPRSRNGIRKISI